MRVVEAMHLLAALLVLQLMLLTKLGLGEQQQQPAKAAFELKFQSEVESGSITKQVSQQQTFKCQVRLAPAGPSSQHNKRRPVTNQLRLLVAQPSDWATTGPKWPANVSLTIGWFKDEEPVGGEGVSVVNTELSKSKTMKNDKKSNNKPRIEIKNTSNEGQLKLTSRLKIGHLKAADSGHYKCVGRAKFLQPAEPAASSPSSPTQLAELEQSLESNGSRLLVEPAAVSTTTLATSNNGHNNHNGGAGPEAGTSHRRQLLDKAHQPPGNAPPAKPHNDMQHASGHQAPSGKLGLADAEMGRPDKDGQRVFEDDEDLFKMDQAERIELISASSPATNDDDEQPADRHQANDPLAADLDELWAPQEEPRAWQRGLGEAPADSNNESSSAYKAGGGGGSGVGGGANNNNNNNDNQHGTTERPNISGGGGDGDARKPELDTNYSPDSGYLAHSLGLARLVHKMAPELGCYTGLGAHYRGNASESADRRPCLNWARLSQLRPYLARWPAWDPQPDHSHCRNPNLDPRGPWCFVRAQVRPQDQQRNLSQLVVARACLVSPCSQYLWLYIVAPPVGLLASLLCLVGILVRALRRAHYNSVFAATADATGKRRSLPAKLGKLLRAPAANRRRFAPKKLVSSSSKRGRYLDEDAFEIVDELDWSDGQQAAEARSPESLKLNAAFGEAADAATRARLNKSPFVDAAPAPAEQRARTQVGPVFATLRCHIRAGLGKPQPLLGLQQQQQRQHNKSSTFIEQCGGPQQPYGAAAAAQAWPSSPGASTDSAASSSSSPDRSSTRPQAGHLISCSTTSEDLGGGGADGLGADPKCTLASELPQLGASSVALASDRQPLYEGKFSQVQMGHVVQQDNNNKPGQMGAQVAVQALKAQAAIDPALFRPATIKLHNLNHLNLLKLIGWAQLAGDEIGLIKTNCSLIYDMAQLVELSDWIHQQGQDMKTGGQEPGADLGIRRNLTCFAKQIALALDYLHDRDIVYRDLACRNCFLDPTKMLVKLATFNAELVLNQAHDDKAQNLKSMIRPKFLLDYYVIDSRPSDCQLLPLSWCPLESILFNKFNKQTDVWSFGCLIYELFSLGEVAYFGYSSKQIIDAVRSNLMPPQPLLCPNGIYKLMCKCLSDIPAIRPNVKQIYEQLNLFSGQCSSFLDHHLCSLATTLYDDQMLTANSNTNSTHHLIDLKMSNSAMNQADSNSITKTKSYANIKHFSPATSASNAQYDNLLPLALEASTRPEPSKLPLSKSINLDGNRLTSFGRNNYTGPKLDGNHYDEPVVEARKKEQE